MNWPWHKHSFKLERGLIDKNTMFFYEIACHTPMIGNCSTYHRLTDKGEMEIWAWVCKCGKRKSATKEDVEASA
jgi:hypothetical protein